MAKSMPVGRTLSTCFIYRALAAAGVPCFTLLIVYVTQDCVVLAMFGVTVYVSFLSWSLVALFHLQLMVKNPFAAYRDPIQYHIFCCMWVASAAAYEYNKLRGGDACAEYNCTTWWDQVGFTGVTMMCWIWVSLRTLMIANSLLSSSVGTECYAEKKAFAARSIRAFAIQNLCEGIFLLTVTLCEAILPCTLDLSVDTAQQLTSALALANSAVVLIDGIFMSLRADPFRPGHRVVSRLWCTKTVQLDVDRISLTDSNSPPSALDLILRDESLQCITQGIVETITAAADSSKRSTGSSTQSLRLEPISAKVIPGAQAWSGQLTQ